MVQAAPARTYPAAARPEPCGIALAGQTLEDPTFCIIHRRVANSEEGSSPPCRNQPRNVKQSQCGRSLSMQATAPRRHSWNLDADYETEHADLQSSQGAKGVRLSDADIETSPIETTWDFLTLRAQTTSVWDPRPSFTAHHIPFRMRCAFFISHTGNCC